MYKWHPDELQNDKCFGCKFCVWDEERHTEVCEVKGCYENTKYVEYRIEQEVKTK